MTHATDPLTTHCLVGYHGVMGYYTNEFEAYKAKKEKGGCVRKYQPPVVEYASCDYLSDWNDDFEWF